MMTGKECVSAVLSRRKADRVPLGFYLVDCDTIGSVIGRKTLVRDTIGQRLALAAGRRDEVVEAMKKDVVEFYRKIDCADLIVPKEGGLVAPKNYEPEKLRRIDDETYEDGHKRVWKISRLENAMLCVHDPTQRTEFKVEDFPMPTAVTPPDPSVFEVLDHIVAELGSDRYICSYNHITALSRPGGFETGLMLYALQPEVIHACNRQSVAYQNANDAHYVRPGTDGIFVEQDMAGNNGPFVSPDMFREMCQPYFKERIQRLKTFREHVLFHNCGMNIPLVDMFIEAGVTCYQSLQTTAGMEIGKLKRMFGDRLVFWGGMPVESLIAGTPEDVRCDVRTAMERGGPGGGFILGPSHSIAYGTKYDNFMAMLDEYTKLRDKWS
ncbi:MAG: hypothetical protein A3K19_17850 [Lentisphaerae bacterium RIFOXYB12_FULL_65_16]|nr:MAG: hypothetical protein A3K18_16165 [Lentisphaerae bacterium RIFOXYA12_64_32]OGV85313.1 MAG: hypothetical protein A3K19_17850 [Lentisphaerae bacterium RIFOXYB12_FULL_65_16]